MPFFSVIMPLYNKANFVEEAVQSVLKQNFDDFELIIIDDCSTDNGLELVKCMASNKIKIHTNAQNKGLSATRNIGIKSAASDYITFLDADDVWDVKFLEKIKSLIETFPNAKIFATNYHELYANGQLVLPRNNFGLAEIISDFFLSSLGKPIYCSCSFCVHKSVFEKVGFYNENITFGEDIDFNIRINSKFMLAYSNTGLVIYRLFSENQITNSLLTDKVITDFDSYDLLAKNNISLQKYLDFNRYIMAKTYKTEGNFLSYDVLRSKIKLANLNIKQRLLLQLPPFCLRFIKRIKSYLNKNNIQINTYSR